MTNKSGDKNFSRKGFLKLGWLKRQSTIESKNDLAPRANYIGVPIDKLNGLGIGNTFKINDHSDIYAVRIAEGIIFLSNLCPYDDAGITWKPNDRSEDAIGTTGRFYCQRCSTIYDRTGEPTAGPGETPLSKLSHSWDNDNSQVMVHGTELGLVESKKLIFRIAE
tara:strand:+ start:39 stop:533 length:495 start_codon:yes stop_codon:yes gene_type:complete